MDPFEQRAAILGHGEHVDEVHRVVKFSRLPLHHVGLDEIVATRTPIGVTFARALDLLRAHLDTRYTTTEMRCDVFASVAHPGTEFEHIVLWSKTYVSAHVIEQRWTTVVGVDLAAV